MKSFIRRRRRSPRLLLAFALAALAALSTAVAAGAATTPAATDLPTQSSAYNAAWQPAPAGYAAPSNDGLGVAPGKIGHVWVIVLENHASNAAFTPLEGTENTYLQNLPSQGALLTHYYGIGHSSQDNYEAMVSGQAPQADTQDDCPSYDAMSGTIDAGSSTDGTDELANNADLGQFVDAAGADAPPGDNGCVYPSSVQTVFNQLDAANKTWKLYSQDVDYTAQAGQNAGIADCGAPESTVQAPLTAGTSRAVNTNDGSANPTSQYIGYHNPLGWFESMLPASMGGTGGDDCANNLEPLFGPNDKLFSDLQNVSSTPDFSFIVPNNCNNGHDAICKGNNLSGEAAGYPAYNTSSTIPAAAASNASTGGTYAESMFLGVVIPEIEASPAFKQNGLIVVTYDEAYPAATYSNDSQNDASLELPDAAGVLQTDAAGETLYGRSVNWEPTGPNATLVTAPSGQIVSPGPGDGANLSRPAAADGALIGCTEPGQTADDWVNFTTPTGSNGVCLPGFQNNENRPATQTTPSLTIAAGSNSVPDTTATAAIQGDQVTSWSAGTPTLMDNGTAYNGNVYVGSVTATPATSGTSAWTGGFSLVDQNGAPVTVVGSYTGTLTVSTEGDVGTNPFYDAFDPTYGGGDAGAVLISPDITPGTVSNTDYNHYSLLRSIEDIFGLGGDPSGADKNSPLYGVGGTGYLGAASQPGLAPFGTDVFTNASQGATTPTVTTTVTNTVTNTVTDTNTVTNTVTNNNTVPGPTDTVTKTVSTPGPTNTVLTPGPTQTVTRTAKVKEVYAVVPFLSGATLAQAKKAISTDGLKLGKVGGSGSVTSMSPKAGTKVKTGTKVSLSLKK